MNSSLISPILHLLPTIQKYSLRNEMDFYGFSSLIANQLKFNYTPLPCISSWKHGWVPQASITYPLHIAHWGSRTNQHVVQTIWQEEFLKRHGYKNVKAAGAPFCYAPAVDVERIPSSLLVVPVHSLAHISLNEKFEAFFEEAAYIGKKFDTVVVCLHQESITENILQVLERYKLQYVLGASAHDGNSLLRMKTLFCQFESLITNQNGSHVPYFNLCGGKSAIVGPYYVFPTEQLEKHEWYKKHPELLEAAKFHSEENIRRHFPFLFVDIEKQICHQKWAASELGQELTLTSEEIETLVGWNFTGRINRFTSNPKESIKSFIGRNKNPIVR
jgi:hypothetical protein